jgi:hypothetical protein
MKTSRINRPSPALVIATAALFVALGGTGFAAFALPKNSVGTKQLKNGAVTAKKLHSASVGTNQIANGAVTGPKINFSGVTAPNAVHATSADSATNASVAANANSATAAASPSTLGSGRSETGMYAVGGTAAAVNAFATESISFAFPLASAPTQHVILLGGASTAACPGSLASPQAAPGAFCLYEGERDNSSSPSVGT